MRSTRRPATPITSGARRRLLAVGLAGATVLTGLGMPFLLPRSVATDVTGDALYAVLVYALVVVIIPSARPAMVAVIAGSLCVAVEAFQLTGVPRAWAAAFPPVALVLGTGFDTRDIFVYIGAVTVAAVTDTIAGRRLGDGGHRDGPGGSRHLS